MDCFFYYFELGFHMCKKILSTLLLTLIISCSTPYKKDGFMGGFSEMKVNEKTWKVDFRGNAYTSSRTVENFALRRAAELTIEQGYSHFVLSESSLDIKKGINYWSGKARLYTKPSANTYIILLSENEAKELISTEKMVFDAKLFLTQFNED